MIQVLTNLVVSLAGNGDIKVVLIGLLFGLMVVGLVLGQELAFVLGGAGVLIGAIAMGDSGITIAMTKIYDQMQSYSMVAIPMFVLMANFLTHSKVFLMKLPELTMKQGKFSLSALRLKFQNRQSTGLWTNTALNP